MKSLWLVVGAAAATAGGYLYWRNQRAHAQIGARAIGEVDETPTENPVDTSRDKGGTQAYAGGYSTFRTSLAGGALPLPAGATVSGKSTDNGSGTPTPPIGSEEIILSSGISTPAGDKRRMTGVDPATGERYGQLSTVDVLRAYRTGSVTTATKGAGKSLHPALAARLGF